MQLDKAPHTMQNTKHGKHLSKHPLYLAWKTISQIKMFENSQTITRSQTPDQLGSRGSKDDSGPAILFFLGCFIEWGDRESTLPAASIPELWGFVELKSAPHRNFGNYSDGGR